MRGKEVTVSCLALLLVSSQVFLGCFASDAVGGSTNDTTLKPSGEKQSHDESFNSDIHIAKLEFERVQTLVIVTVFIMVVVLAKLGEVVCVS